MAYPRPSMETTGVPSDGTACRDDPRVRQLPRRPSPGARHGGGGDRDAARRRPHVVHADADRVDASPALGTGSSATGYYRQIGRMVHGCASIVWGSSGTAAVAATTGCCCRWCPPTTTRPSASAGLLDFRRPCAVRGRLRGRGGRPWAAATKAIIVVTNTAGSGSSSRGQPGRRSDPCLVGERQDPAELRLRGIHAVTVATWADPRRRGPTRRRRGPTPASPTWSRRSGGPRPPPGRHPVWEDITDYVLSGHRPWPSVQFDRTSAGACRCFSTTGTGRSTRRNNQAPTSRIRATVGSVVIWCRCTTGGSTGCPQACDRRTTPRCSSPPPTGSRAGPPRSFRRDLRGVVEGRTARGAGGVSQTTCR